MKLLDGKWSINALGGAVLDEDEGVYVVRSVAEAIDLMMVIDSIFVTYPSEQPLDFDFNFGEYTSSPIFRFNLKEELNYMVGNGGDKEEMMRLRDGLRAYANEIDESIKNLERK